ncbi:MAG: 50S ribosomal protein L18 [Candidatus Microsyncoccus archaeolyticus]|nr:MAG: 50S ribosomal protein L18 [Candidatus Parcubacteria bacterium]
MLEKKEKRIKRHKRVRAKIKGDAKIPRLCVFRSASHIYAQLIDDEKGKTIISVKDTDLKGKKSDIAKKVGSLIAEKAKEKKIEKIVFDRGGYKYHGRVKALSDGVREGGLKF